MKHFNKAAFTQTVAQHRAKPGPPRYVSVDGHWYVLKEHMADQLRSAIESAEVAYIQRAIEMTRRKILQQTTDISVQ